LIAGALDPGQKLPDGPAVGGPGVQIADGNREKLEEFLARGRISPRNHRRGRQGIDRHKGKLGVRHLPLKTTLKGPLFTSDKRGYAALKLGEANLKM